MSCAAVSELTTVVARAGDHVVVGGVDVVDRERVGQERDQRVDRELLLVGDVAVVDREERLGPDRVLERLDVDRRIERRPGLGERRAGAASDRRQLPTPEAPWSAHRAATLDAAARSGRFAPTSLTDLGYARMVTGVTDSDRVTSAGSC